MIFNIIDRRQNKYRWKRITAIIEPIWHDNYRGDRVAGDMYPSTPELEEKAGIGYDEIETCSVATAVAYATELEYPCTLFLYDHGANNLERVIRPNLKEENEKKPFPVANLAT